MLDISTLNAEQREAVLDFEHNLLILACAGSGKTRTITSKIAYAIEKGIYKPWQICAVTFTNKAAKEMRERVERMVGSDVSEMEVRTFHSLGAYLLRRFGEEAGLDADFTIYDADDSLQLFSSIYSEKTKKDLKPILNAIMRLKEAGIMPSDPRVIDEYDESVREHYIAYDRALRVTGNADFADLINLTAEILKDPTGRAASYVHNRFRLLLVDEYQDSSDSEFLLLDRLRGERTQVVVVGDDDQSIYSFRGADINNILSFERMLPGVREVKLEKNYRSTDDILRPAGILIANNRTRHQKEIVSADGKTGGKPYVIRSIDARVEADKVATEILINKDFDSTAIIYRTNAQSQPFELAFTALKIPYKVVGALKFYEREEVKDILAIMYLLMNHRDSVSFRRIINKPIRGLGEKRVAKILSYGEDLYEGLKKFIAETKGSKQGEAASIFLSAWDKAEKALMNEDEDVSNLGLLAKRAFEDFGLYDYYRSEEDRTIRDSKLQNAEQLVNALAEAGSGRDNLRAFLERLTLDNSVLGSHDPRDDRGVTLITMHNAKGLEFDNVFLVGLEEEIIPGVDTEGDDVEEERRLLYVAMTRARKKLYMSYADERFRWGRTEYSTPTRFFDEIPSELLAGDKTRLVKQKKTSSSYPFFSSTPSWQGKRWAEGLDGTLRTKDNSKVNLKNNSSSSYYDKGDRVWSPNYGDGVVVGASEQNGRRIITVLFGERKQVKYVEALAHLEKRGN